MLTPDQITAIIAAIIALISAITAYLKNKETNTTIAAMTPGTIESQTPAIITTLPVRTWTMTESTKEWCTFDATPENRVTILQQIDEAETQHLTHYQVHFKGGFYIIDYGLLMGGAGNPSGK